MPTAIPIDLLSNPRLMETTQLLERVSGLDDPQEVQRAFSVGMGRMNPIEAYLSISARGLSPGAYKITRRLLTPDARLQKNNDPWKRWDTLPTHTGGFVGEAIATPVPKLFHNLFLKDDPILGDEIASFGSAIATPLFDEGRALNWSLLLHPEPTYFNEDHVEEFLLRGNLIGRVTRSLVIRREVQRLNEQLTEQMMQIAAIQRALLPERTPDVPGLDIATSYLTSNHAGGDHFDFFPLSDGRFGVLIADVAGHGAGAATVAAMLHAIMRTRLDRESSPAELLTFANHQLLGKRIENSFITAFMGVFDADRRTLTYSNAGHNRPLLHTPGAETVPIDGAASIPLGIVSDIPYENATVKVDPGDALVLYTDGIVEAFTRGPQREMFGVEGLIRSLESCTGHPECVINSIHTGLFEHTQSRDRDDDQTIVAIQVRR